VPFHRREQRPILPPVSSREHRRSRSSIWRFSSAANAAARSTIDLIFAALAPGVRRAIRPDYSVSRVSSIAAHQRCACALAHRADPGGFADRSALHVSGPDLIRPERSWRHEHQTWRLAMLVNALHELNRNVVVFAMAGPGLNPLSLTAPSASISSISSSTGRRARAASNVSRMLEPVFPTHMFSSAGDER